MPSVVQEGFTRLLPHSFYKNLYIYLIYIQKKKKGRPYTRKIEYIKEKYVIFKDCMELEKEQQRHVNIYVSFEKGCNKYYSRIFYLYLNLCTTDRFWHMRINILIYPGRVLKHRRSKNCIFVSLHVYKYNLWPPTTVYQFWIFMIWSQVYYHATLKIKMWGEFIRDAIGI